jgi:hypothetical protein
MIHRVKTSIVLAVAVACVFGVSAAAASASVWKVEAKTLGATEKKTIKEEAKVGGENVLRWNGTEVQCKALHVVNGFIEGATANGAEHLNFKECSVLKPAAQGCTVATGEITTVPVVSALEGTNVKFKAKEGENFTEFKLSGELCAVKGKYIVHGTATGAIENPAVEAVEKTLNFTATSSALKVGEQAAEFVNKIGLQLTSGQVWTGA